MRLIALLILALLVVGCGPTSRTYSVSIDNQASEPYLVWLTKSGPPVEQAWMSPEQVAVYGLDKGTKVPGAVVAPGKTISRSNVTGKFDGRSEAILRVYRGERKFAELLAIQSDSPNRTDLVLSPGQNNILIDKAGKASVQSTGK
jgi:hypothetical protein